MGREEKWKMGREEKWKMVREEISHHSPEDLGLCLGVGDGLAAARRRAVLSDCRDPRLCVVDKLWDHKKRERLTTEMKIYFISVYSLTIFSGSVSQHKKISVVAFSTI